MNKTKLVIPEVWYPNQLYSFKKKPIWKKIDQTKIGL